MAPRAFPVSREAAAATIVGLERFAVQSVRRLVRLQERRRKVRRELKVIDDEIRMTKSQLRAVVRSKAPGAELDTPLPARVSGE